jgi:5-methylcytosine-specific restriction endonuclease McrA
VRSLRRWIQRSQQGNQRDRKPLSAEERLALRRIRVESRRAHAKLKSAGRGGLPPSLVLHVFRRDKWRCKRCGTNGPDKGGLTLHHVGGIVESEWLSKKGHKNEPNNIVTLCNACHDTMHEEARKEGTDSSQVLAEADKGTRHDHGQPDFSA